jgi:hypothetical protein
LDHAAVCHDEDVAVFVLLKDLVDCGSDARFEVRGALSARHEVPVRFFDPARPRIRIFLGDLFGVQALPLAEIDLA